MGRKYVLRAGDEQERSAWVTALHGGFRLTRCSDMEFPAVNTELCVHLPLLLSCTGSDARGEEDSDGQSVAVLHIPQSRERARKFRCVYLRASHPGLSPFYLYSRRFVLLVATAGSHSRSNSRNSSPAHGRIAKKGGSAREPLTVVAEVRILTASHYALTGCFLTVHRLAQWSQMSERERFPHPKDVDKFEALLEK